MYYTTPDKCRNCTTSQLRSLWLLTANHTPEYLPYGKSAGIPKPLPHGTTLSCLFWVVLHQLLKQWDHHNDLSHLGQDFEQIRSKCHGHLFAYINYTQEPANPLPRPLMTNPKPNIQNAQTSHLFSMASLWIWRNKSFSIYEYMNHKYIYSWYTSSLLYKCKIVYTSKDWYIWIYMYTWLTLCNTYLYIRTYYVCILYIMHFSSASACQVATVKLFSTEDKTKVRTPMITNNSFWVLAWITFIKITDSTASGFLDKLPGICKYPSNRSPKAFVMMSKPPKSLKLPWTKKQSASGNHSLHFHACLLHMFIAVMSSFTTYSLDNQTWSICFMSITSTPSADCGGTFVSIHNFHNGQRTQEKEHHLVPVAVGMRTPKFVKLKDAFWTVSNNSVLNHYTDFFKKSPAHRLRDIFQSLLDGSIKVGRRHIHSGADQGPNQDLEKEWSPQFHVLGYQFWKIRN